MTVVQLSIDASLVRRLVAVQFPQWADLPVRPVAQGGWDNRTFHLGEQMLVRLPSAQRYASQVEREQCWLPKLAPRLPVAIPEPLAMGEPAFGYPWKWSVYRWIEGQPLAQVQGGNLITIARDLATFLSALQAIDATGGPRSGQHSFHRGGSLSIYTVETRSAVEALGDRVDAGLAMQVWDRAIQSSWDRPPVWVHGDVAAGNLLVQAGRLIGVIDFGQLSVGDPACDLVMAWTHFDLEVRNTFRSALKLDPESWARGRGWALWKALLVAAGQTNTHAAEAKSCWHTINEVLTDHTRAES